MADLERLDGSRRISKLELALINKKIDAVNKKAKEIEKRQKELIETQKSTIKYLEDKIVRLEKEKKANGKKTKNANH